MFKEKVEELIVNTKETMEEADRRIGEIKISQNELKDYTKTQISLINNTSDMIIKLIKDKQAKLIKDLNGAVNIEEKKLELEEMKYTKIKSELQEKDIYLGNLLVLLADNSKLTDEREMNLNLDEKRTQIQLLYHKTHKGGIPIVHLPYFNVDSESMTSAIEDFIRIHVSEEDYGIKKKICYFGETNHVLKFDIETETWEHKKIRELYEFSYYAAATSTHDGDALIVGGGSSTNVFLYSEIESNYNILT